MSVAAPAQSASEPVHPNADAAERGPSVALVVNVITAVTVVVFWLVVTSWRPWNLFADADFSAAFYDEQARAFLRGRLDVDPSIPGPEGFVIDGRTYLYYGPFLSIVRLPFMLVGDLLVGRLVRISMLIAIVVLCRWTARLARVARRVVAGAGARLGDERWAIGGLTAAVACSPALFAAGWVSVYNETELWALTLAVVALASIAEWAAGGFDDRRACAIACAATIAATLTRAPIGGGVAVALAACGAWSALRDRGPAGQARWAVAAAVGGVAAHAAVNWAKFGSLTSVPGDRQLLSLADPERAAWFAGNDGSFFSLRFLPTTIVQYLRPDTVAFERLIPWVRFGPLATDRGSYPVESITPSSSLPTTATLLMGLAIVGVAWMVRHRARTWLVMVGATALGAIPTFTIGFIANRYLIDMLPPLVVGAAIGVWVVGAWPRQRLVRAFGVALVAWGAWVNVSLATWTLEAKSPGFTELRYDLDRAVFGAGAPGLVELQPGTPVPRDGVVALDPDCAGVYIAEQGAWVALERADGVRRTGGTIDAPAGPVVIAAGDGWTIQAAAGEDGLDLQVFGASGEVRLEERVGESLPVRYEVVIDPVSREFFATVGSTTVLLPGDLRALEGSIAPGSSPSGDAPRLCRELRRSR